MVRLRTVSVEPHPGDEVDQVLLAPGVVARGSNPSLPTAAKAALVRQVTTMSAKAQSGRSDWLIPAMLILLSLVPATFGTVRLVELAGGAEITPANARFFANPFPVALHILVVIPYSIVGAFQFAPRFRRRNRGWHRAAGRVVAGLGLVAALTGLWMTLAYPWPEGDGEVLYVIRLVFGSAMAVSIVLAIRAIRRGDFASHGAWMMRGYAIGLGAGTQVLTHLPWFVLVGKPGEASRAFLMGAGWVINLLVAEWIIRRSRARRRARASAAGVRAPDGVLAAGLEWERRREAQPSEPAP